MEDINLAFESNYYILPNYVLLDFVSFSLTQRVGIQRFKKKKKRLGIFFPRVSKMLVIKGNMICKFCSATIVQEVPPQKD